MEENGRVDALREAAKGLHLTKTVVLVGLMGAGKTTVGRRVAAALDVPFRDADQEIERAAGLTVQEIFAAHGEAEFRRGERQVIARLLGERAHVLATGGGAFIDPATRAAVKERGVSIWLRAELETLAKRVERRDTRPLLKGQDVRAVLGRLMAERYPIYAEADLVVDSGAGPLNKAAEAVLNALRPIFGEAVTANER